MSEPTDLTRFLQALPGFRELSPPELARLAGSAREHSWADGQPILRAGEPSDAMHVLISGRAQVVLGGGPQRRCIPMEPGAVFGEIGMLSGGPRTADVVAEGATRTLALRRRDVEPLLWEHPPLARFLTGLVRRRLQRSGDLARVGPYRIEELIGRGASSDVFAAVHEGLGRGVAVKMLSHSLAFDRPFRDRFVNEGRIVASLDHPNIVRVFDTAEAFATYFIVMERLEGTDLRAVLSRNGALSVDEAAPLLAQAASALSFAHGCGVAHGDVKPANCGLGVEGKLKLMDFGLARRLDGAASRGDGFVVGTPFYMAPELIRGAPASPASDTYALGAMAFEILTGTQPFRGEPRDVLRKHLEVAPPDIGRALPGVPPTLARFIRGALDKDPSRRPLLGDLADKLGMLAPRNVLDPARAVTSLHLTHPVADQATIDALVTEFEGRVSRLARVEVVRAHGPSTPRPRPASSEPAPVPATLILDRG